jgi:hypothetical protein
MKELGLRSESVSVQGSKATPLCNWCNTADGSKGLRACQPTATICWTRPAPISPSHSLFPLLLTRQCETAPLIGNLGNNCIPTRTENSRIAAPITKYEILFYGLILC